MNFKRLSAAVLSGSMLFLLNACSKTPENESKNTEVRSSEVSYDTRLPSQIELKEILEKTIPDYDDHFDTTDEGLEAFIRQVEEFPVLVDLTMIDTIRERGNLYFNELQMERLNKAFDETTAL